MIHELLETENRLYLKIDDLSVQVAVLSRELKRLDPTLVKGEGGEGT